MKFDINKSLQELENSNWGEPKSDSPLEQACLLLRRIPLIEFEGRDLLRMITQEIGLEYLIPLALERLRLDPLADRDFYPGCLLSALLEASSKYWDKNPDFREEVQHMYDKVLLNEKNDEDLDRDTIARLKGAYLTFIEFGPLISLLWDNATVKKTCNCSAVEILSIIACRQPITLQDLGNITPQMIEFLLKQNFIRYDYEGSYPANRYFRLRKSFSKELGLRKNKG